jgi:hypothetical protein
MNHKQSSLPTTLCPQCHTSITLPPGDSPRRFSSLVAASVVATATFFLGFFWPGNKEPEQEGGAKKPTAAASTGATAKTRAPAPVIRKIAKDSERDEAWDTVAKTYHAGPESIVFPQPPFEKGTAYQFTLKVTQIGEDFLLTNRFRNAGPFGILRCAPGALDDVALENNESFKAVIRFTGYEQVTMVSGVSERLASFKLLALYSFRGLVCSFE